MKFTELKEALDGGAEGAFLLEGEDGYFRNRGEEMIKQKYLEFPELNFTSFEGENLKGAGISALVAAVKNYPFMAEKRVVKVSEFYPSDTEFESYLKPLFADFPATCVLIIVNSGAGKKGAELKRRKGITFVDCGRAEPESVAKWAYITLKRAGIVCSAAACADIAAYCLYDMARVAVEVQKLIDYKGAGELSKDEIDALVYRDADYRVYEMTNAVARRDFTKYCEIRNDLSAKGYDETGVLNGLFSYFKNLLSAAASPLSDSQYAKECGAKEFVVKKNREHARAIGAKNVENYVKYIYVSISDIKSGRISAAGALQNCENLIFFDRM